MHYPVLQMKQWNAGKNVRVIGIIGGSGFLGTEIANGLRQEGHTVRIFSRHPSDPTQYVCNLSTLDGWETQLNGLDCLINLSGLSIGDGFWTQKRRTQLYDSRILSTRVLVQALADLETPPRLFINASAVGYYPDSTTLHDGPGYSETAAPGTSFLSQLCQDWEHEAFKTKGLRVCTLRLGIVIGNGGLLKKLLPIFRLGLGHIFGKGDSPFSWIHSGDVARIILFLMSDENVHGPINCISPNTVSYRHFAKALASQLKRPLLFSVPSFLIALLGPMSDLFLKGNHAVPQTLISHGFQFRFPLLEDALHDAIPVITTTK